MSDSKETPLYKKLAAVLYSNLSARNKEAVEKSINNDFCSLAMKNPIVHPFLNLIERNKNKENLLLKAAIIEMEKRNTYLESQLFLFVQKHGEFKDIVVNAENLDCDHDWENMGDYMQCTYPECQAIKQKVRTGLTGEQLRDGYDYLFNYKGNTYFGKYEALSGNFFVGGDETHQKHTHCFEAAACESIEYSAF